MPLNCQAIPISTPCWPTPASTPSSSPLLLTPRFELARSALEAGKHLLLEKPVALDADQVEELQRMAILRRLCVAVDFEYRAVPLFQQLQALLREGWWGIPGW